MIINQDSDSLDGSVIRKSMLNGQLPVIDYAEIKNDLYTTSIQIPKIDSIQTMSRNNSTLTLFLVGLAVDVIIFNYWAHEMGRLGN
jgi:hypothetical protein